MEKRGEMQHELMINIFDLLLAGTLLLSLLGAIHQIETKDMIKKEYLSKDLALLIDAVYASPGDIQVYYENADASLADFSFGWGSQKVSVSEAEPGKGTPVRIYYPFAIDRSFKTDFKDLEKPEAIAVSKTADTVFIDSTKRRTGIIACPEIATAVDDKKGLKIMIDPGHGGKDRGFSGAVVEADTVRMLAEELGTSLAADYDVYYTRDIAVDEEASTEERLRRIGSLSPDMMISLHCGRMEDAHDSGVVIYVNPRSARQAENMKLACMIRNNFIRAFSVENIRIRQIDPETIRDTRAILSVEGLERQPVEAYVEIGNVNQMLSESILAPEADKLGKIQRDVISKAVREFYG